MSSNVLALPSLILSGRNFYKPFSTRAPVLIFLLLCTLGLIALSEVAVRRLPAHEGVGRLGKVAEQLNQTLNLNVGRDFKRQEWSKSYFFPISDNFFGALWSGDSIIDAQ